MPEQGWAARSCVDRDFGKRIESVLEAAMRDVRVPKRFWVDVGQAVLQSVWCQDKPAALKDLPLTVRDQWNEFRRALRAVTQQ